MPASSPEPAAWAGPRLPAHSSSPSRPPSLLPSWLSLFCFAASHPRSSPSSPSLLFWSSLAVAGSYLPILRVRRVLFPCLCPRDARPLWGALCLLPGLCEPVCAHTCVSEPRSTPCGLGALGSGPCLWPPQALCTTPRISQRGAGEAPCSERWLLGLAGQCCRRRPEPPNPGAHQRGAWDQTRVGAWGPGGSAAPLTSQACCPAHPSAPSHL